MSSEQYIKQISINDTTKSPDELQYYLYKNNSGIISKKEDDIGIIYKTTSIIILITYIIIALYIAKKYHDLHI
jgi:hypothetical protein